MDLSPNQPIQELVGDLAQKAVSKKLGTQDEPQKETGQQEGAETQATEGAEGLKEQTPTEPTKESSPQELELSKAFAALARKEKKLLELQRQIAAKEKQPGYISLEELKAKAAQDPDSVLSTLGLDFNGLVDKKLASEPTLEDKLREVTDKVTAYERQAEENKKKREEQARQEQLDKAIQSFKNEIRQTAEQDKEKYELVHAYDEIDAVYEVCEEYFAKTQKHLDIGKALEAVEQKLQLELESKALKTNKAKRFFESLNQPNPAIKQSPEAKKDSLQPTLTNRMTLQPSLIPEQKLLSREESIKRAAAMLKWSK
jgi:hypothetical protein